MVSLIDIGPLTSEVELRGTTLKVKGVSAKFVFDLLASSSEIRMIFAQRQIDGDIISSLVAQAPTAIAEFIAAGCGKPGDPETMAFALTELSAGETLLLAQAIFNLSFPQGVKSFVDGLSALVPSSNSAGAPGWAADMKSPAPSNDASAPDTTSTDAGNTLPGS